MKLVSWNVAGFRACLKKGFANFFNEIQADVFCIQEVKSEKGQYDFHPKDYYEYLFSAKRKGYSGTLIYTKRKPITVKYGMNVKAYDEEGRIITLEYENCYIVNAYIPNVKRTLERMTDRMNWELEFCSYLKKLDAIKPVIVCGDFNVAHTELDIRNAKQNIGNAGFTYEEREKFTELLSSGFIDTFRYLYPKKADSYTWWSYRKGARERNIGWRIDYFLISERWKNHIKSADIYSNIYGSDHCPIGLEIQE